jgi:hypothetical protein
VFAIHLTRDRDLIEGRVESTTSDIPSVVPQEGGM